MEICLRDALPPTCTKNPVLRPFLVVTMELAFAPWLLDGDLLAQSWCFPIRYRK